jgi:hypothetical protein
MIEFLRTEAGRAEVETDRARFGAVAMRPGDLLVEILTLIS